MGKKVASYGFTKGHGLALAMLLLISSSSYAESAGVPLPPLPQTVQAVAASAPSKTPAHTARKMARVNRHRHHAAPMLSQSVPAQAVKPATIVPVPEAPETANESVASNAPLPALPDETLNPSITTDGFSQMAQESSEPLSLDETPLEDLYKQREARYGHYTSPGYLMRLFGLLTLILGGFYLLARYAFPKWFANKRSEPLIPFSSSASHHPDQAPETRKPLLKSLIPSLGEPSPFQPQVLSRTRLSPSKEIHVIQVGDRRLVVGSTAQNMTLLAELPMEPPVKPSPETAVNTRSVLKDEDMEHIYKKYLKPSATPPKTPQGNVIPEDEEVVLLDDYEDDFNRLS